MTYTITIYRQERGSREHFWQSFHYDAAGSGDSVASALTFLNRQPVLLDTEGKEARRISWESSCLQKKCGACAMVVNGYPRLACGTRLEEFRDRKIQLSPLRKFPLIEDLMVDREIMYQNLRTMELWLREDAALSDRDQELAYQASECLQCGCCLEICPNFYAGGAFFGMAAVPITTRLLTEQDRAAIRDMRRNYRKHVFAGCGKSLACKTVCPKGIDTEELLVNANRRSAW